MKKGFSIQTWINIFILAGFTIWFLLKSNYEFLLYTFTISILIYIIERTDKMFKYSELAKWGFSVWLFSHFAGGSFHFAGQRLYDIILINIIGDPFNILKYDQLIHVFCYLVLTLFLYSLVTYNNKKDFNKIMFSIIVILASIGLGAVNEMIEFVTVIFFDAGAAVGGYYNTALDLVFNSIGAVIAVFFMNNKKKT